MLKRNIGSDEAAVSASYHARTDPVAGLRWGVRVHRDAELHAVLERVVA